MATKATDANQSTKKVPRKTILIGWQVKRPKYTVDPTTKKRVNAGSIITVRGTSLLYYPSKIIDWYNIPTYAGAGGANAGDVSIINVDASTKNFYDAIDDAAARTLNVREFERLGGSKQRRGRVMSVAVPLGDGRVTPKGNPRTVSFAFPGFFNLIMVTQALGQMLTSAPAAKKPSYFNSQSGVTYPIYYTSKTATDAPMQGASSGAWLASAFLAPTNVDNPDDIPDSPDVASTAGDRNG